MKSWHRLTFTNCSIKLCWLWLDSPRLGFIVGETKHVQMVGARIAHSQDVEEALQEIACVGTNIHKEDTFGLWIQQWCQDACSSRLPNLKDSVRPADGMLLATKKGDTVIAHIFNLHQLIFCRKNHIVHDAILQKWYTFPNIPAVLELVIIHGQKDPARLNDIPVKVSNSWWLALNVKCIFG